MPDVKSESPVKAKKVSAAKKPAAADQSATAKAPVAKVEKVTAPKARAATATKKPATAKASNSVTPEQRYKMICDAAYYKAERRGFSPENEVQDWLDAEAEINSLLG